ncbi:hypothetical protein [Okeania sp. SIO3B5]|nr:hypothetical protein [Okeania sp. SIO3B5]
MENRNKQCLTREEDAPTAMPRNKHYWTIHDHYNAPRPLVEQL